MKFLDQQLHKIAEQYYFTEYLSLLNTRKIRKNAEFSSYLNSYTMPDKPLERTLRNTLSNLNPNVHPSVKENIESILSTGNYISDTDPNINMYVSALDRFKSFTFPTSTENNLRAQEEINFQEFITNNPRTDFSSPTLEQNREFLKLIIE